MSKDVGCSPVTQVDTMGRLLEVASDCNPREMADAEDDSFVGGHRTRLTGLYKTRALRKRGALVHYCDEVMIR